MLSYMRKYSNVWVKWIIFGAIIVVFVAWGGSSYYAKMQNQIAKVDKDTISIQQYQKQYSDTIDMYQRQFGGKISPEMLEKFNIKQKVLDGMIEGILLEKEASKLGVTVATRDIQKQIESIPAFLVNGKFDMSTYTSLLQNMKTSPQEFENNLRKDISRQRLYQIITDAVVVTPQEIEISYRQKNDSFDLNFITLNPDDLKSTIAPGETEIKAWYDAHKESYKLQSETIASCISFDSANYVAKSQIGDKEVTDYYESHRKQYSIPATYQLKQIVIRIPPNADQKALAAGDKESRRILDIAKSGKEDFASLAKKFSQDISASKGGDMGTVKKDMLPGPLASKLASMKPGDIAGPVRTDNGFYLLKLESKTDEIITPVEAVKGQITDILKKEDAKDKWAYNDAQSTYAAIYEKTSNMDLTGYAKKNSLAVVEYGPFAKDGKIDIPGGEKIVSNLSSKALGDLCDEPIDTGTSFVICKVSKKIPARIPELKDVRDKVVAEFITSKSIEAAQKKGDEIIKMSPDARAALNPDSTGLFKRSAAIPPKLGQITGLKNDLGSLSKPKTYKNGNKVYVVWTKSMANADSKAITEADRLSLKNELLSMKKNLLFDDFLAKAKAEHTIVINKDKM